jgi:hypothetical protein
MDRARVVAENSIFRDMEGTVEKSVWVDELQERAYWVRFDDHTLGCFLGSEVQVLMGKGT